MEADRVTATAHLHNYPPPLSMLRHYCSFRKTGLDWLKPHIGKYSHRNAFRSTQLSNIWLLNIHLKDSCQLHTHQLSHSEAKCLITYSTYYLDVWYSCRWFQERRINESSLNNKRLKSSLKETVLCISVFFFFLKKKIRVLF